MIDDARLKELAFDLYERYILLERIGQFFRPRDSTYNVLDVGGHTEPFWPGFPSLAGALLPDARAVVVDMIPTAALQNYVRANGTQLPFRDGAFDLVCSLDTLEHIPGECRPGFLTELIRVTRDGLYLAFPFDSVTNRWAESVMVEYANVVLKKPIASLLEHRKFGLPDRESVAYLLGGNSHPWVGFGQGNTDVWLLTMLTYHTLRMPGTDFVHELNRRFNQAYAAEDWEEPHHRAGFFLSKRRSIADLEALRASFSWPGRRADLQRVLALCQLFLTTAHNGRVIADKDRYIRHIEGQLAQMRLDGKKLDEAAAAVLQISEISAQLKRMRSQIDDLQNRVELGARLDDRMRDLEIGLVSNKRAIQAIYDSRIWQALRSLGGLLLRATGRRSVPDAEASWSNREFAADPTLQSGADAAAEFVGLTCDYPGEREILPVRDIVEIRGWVIAKTGIDRVLVQIGDEAPVAATYGIPRPDVARSHPAFLDAGQSGYRYFWDTAGLPEGICLVRVTAVAGNGKTRELVCKVRIDWRTPPDYGLWIARHEPTADALRQMREDTGNLAARPRISILVPVYKTPAGLLARCIESVREQVYPNWELCLVDDGSSDAAVTDCLQKAAQSDSRIRVTALQQNRGIAAATNAAWRLSTGEYVAFLDHDDELAGVALSEVVRAINAHPDTEIFYSDEDKIDEQGRRYDAFFKPEWSPELFRSCNYVCHFVVMKRALMESLGGLDEGFNGAQDYDLLLRASEQTQEIVRIPKVLYHWRAIPGSAAKGLAEKPEASGDGERALAAHLARTAPGARVEEVGACRYRVRYPISGDPRISILMPSGGRKNLFRAFDNILEKTEYKNYEVWLIDNSRAEQVKEYATQCAARQAPLHYVDWRGKPFNFSHMNNAVARMTASPYLLFLNDDISIITGEWLTAMLEHAQRPEIGAVGAQLWYPNNVIQHAGVVMGLFGNCSHAFKGLPGERSHYFDFPSLIRNCSAVTGACLLVGRDKFYQAGGFDEVNLGVAFQDVDLCLTLLELGYHNVYTPYARLYHYESVSKAEKDRIPDPVEDAFMKKKWARYIADDPYYNPNLCRRQEDFSLAFD